MSKKNTKSPVSVVAFAAMLRSNEQYQSDRRQLEAKQSVILARYKEAERPLRADLCKVGIDVDSVWRIDHSGPPYPEAIPVLLHHLGRDYPPLVREGIALALGQRWARDQAWDELIELYLREPNLSRIAPPGEIGAPSGAKIAMAAGIDAMARPSDIEQLVELIKNPNNGPSRIMLVRALSRSRNPRALETLARLSNDPELNVEIGRALKGKMRRAAKKAGKSSAKQ